MAIVFKRFAMFNLFTGCAEYFLYWGMHVPVLMRHFTRSDITS